MVRLRDAFNAAFADLWAATTAIQLHSFLNDLHLHSDPSASMGDFHVQSFATLAAAGAFYTAVALIYRHLHQAEAAPAAGNRRLPELVAFVLMVAAALLHSFLPMQLAGGSIDHDRDVDGAARKLGLAALSVLPAAATVTFFWGIVLLFLAHIRAGGEGGGGAAGAFAGDLQIQGPVSLLTKIAFGAAAALVGLMVMALYLYGEEL